MLVGPIGSTKYLTLRLDFDSAYSIFQIRLGASASYAVGSSPEVFLKWYKSDATGGPAQSSWFNAKIDSTISGGCGVDGGFTNNRFSIVRPPTVTDTVYFGEYNVFVVIGYNGTIDFRQINVTD